jgi:hypothetical protein
MRGFKMPLHEFEAENDHTLKWTGINQLLGKDGGELLFISSTCYDLIDLRYELYDAMLEWGLRPLLSDIATSNFEHFNIDSISTCLKNVDRSDAFVLILSQRYSVSLNKFIPGKNYGSLSATHVELCRALELRYQKENKETQNIQNISFQNGPDPLPVIICIREELYQAYKNWKEPIGDNQLNRTLREFCQPPCRKAQCPFSELLICCVSFLENKTTKFTSECQASNFSHEFIEKCCNRVKKMNNSWLRLSSESNTSSRIQALAQFFLIHILEMEPKTQWSQFYVKRFSTISDLKDYLYPLLRPNMYRAAFIQDLVNSNIPVIHIEIQNIYSGAPLYLYLTLKNTSQVPLFWTHSKPLISIYRKLKSDYTTTDSQDWQAIGELISDDSHVETTNSALLPGESITIRILRKNEMQDPASLYYYFLQINYRTVNALFVADIFEIDSLEPRPSIRFIKKIPFPPDSSAIKTKISKKSPLITVHLFSSDKALDRNKELQNYARENGMRLVPGDSSQPQIAIFLLSQYDTDDFKNKAFSLTETQEAYLRIITQNKSSEKTFIHFFVQTDLYTAFGNWKETLKQKHVLPWLSRELADPNNLKEFLKKLTEINSSSQPQTCIESPTNIKCEAECKSCCDYCIRELLKTIRQLIVQSLHTNFDKENVIGTHRSHALILFLLIFIHDSNRTRPGYSNNWITSFDTVVDLKPKLKRAIFPSNSIDFQKALTIGTLPILAVKLLRYESISKNRYELCLEVINIGKTPMLPCGSPTDFLRILNKETKIISLTSPIQYVEGLTPVLTTGERMTYRLIISDDTDIRKIIKYDIVFRFRCIQSFTIENSFILQVQRNPRNYKLVFSEYKRILD